MGVEKALSYAVALGLGSYLTMCFFMGLTITLFFPIEITDLLMGNLIHASMIFGGIVALLTFCWYLNENTEEKD